MPEKCSLAFFILYSMFKFFLSFLSAGSDGSLNEMTGFLSESDQKNLIIE
ncbi:Uncharacterized protein dnm_004040 [Desulfonema magnum]|uniref:Uncharacterized protein n=1 Tax=Desulfonema magnum TaxID=45655 RepID=A0A975BFM7_9BACT|nr:Uncharacterized protein dnm_004040 [Desulfonema magnum]